MPHISILNPVGPTNHSVTGVIDCLWKEVTVGSQQENYLQVYIIDSLILSLNSYSHMKVSAWSTQKTEGIFFGEVSLVSET